MASSDSPRGEFVPPDDREVAAERLADGPRVRRVDDAAGDLERHPRLGVLLEEVGDVGAREIVEDEVGLRRLDLGDVLTEVRRARGREVAPDLRALVAMRRFRATRRRSWPNA